MEGVSFNPLSLYTPEWAALGTGLKPLNEKTTEELGELPDSIKDLIKPQVPTLFGDYPVESGETVGNAVLIAVFGVLMVCNLFIFLKGKFRGHTFWPMFAMVWFCVFMMIGFGLRLKWADNFMDVEIGIAAVVFTQTPIMIIEVINFYLSTRVFTWRHPDAGRSKLQRTYNGIIYTLVIGLIIMAILGSSIPNLYFLTPAAYKRCQQVAQAASVLQIIYSLTAVLNVLNAYMLKPGKIGRKFFWGEKPSSHDTYPHVRQAHWVEKFSGLYFPPKADRVVYHDDENGRAHRVLSSSAPPAGGLVRSVDYDQAQGSMTVNITIIMVTAGYLLACSIVRCTAMFITGQRGGSDDMPYKHKVFHNYIMFIFYGGFLAFINLYWLVMRIDLRFYQPDKPRKRKSGEPRQQDFFEHNQKQSLEKSTTHAHSEHQ